MGQDRPGGSGEIYVPGLTMDYANNTILFRWVYGRPADQMDADGTLRFSRKMRRGIVADGAGAGRNSFTFPVDDGPVEIIYEASGSNHGIIGPSRADFQVRTFGDGQVRIIRL